MFGECPSCSVHTMKAYGDRTPKWTKITIKYHKVDHMTLPSLLKSNDSFVWGTPELKHLEKCHLLMHFFHHKNSLLSITWRDLRSVQYYWYTFLNMQCNAFLNVKVSKGCFWFRKEPFSETFFKESFFLSKREEHLNNLKNTFQL